MQYNVAMMNMRQHLLSRYFNPDRYSGVYLDDAESCATFLLWNLSGKPVGYQTYHPLQPKKEVGDPRLQKYFSWVTKPPASKNAELAVWGLETYRPNDYLFLTEGVFDAARLHWHSLPAVAVLSNNPEHLKEWLFALPARTVAAVQGDKAGQRLARYGVEALYLPENEDVGSLSEEAFLQTFSRYLSR